MCVLYAAKLSHVQVQPQVLIFTSCYLLVLKLPNNFSARNKKCEESHQRVGHSVEGGGQVVDGVAVRQAGVSLNERLKNK